MCSRGEVGLWSDAEDAESRLGVSIVELSEERAWRYSTMGRECEVSSVAMFGRERGSGLVSVGGDGRLTLGSSNCSGEDTSSSWDKRLSCSKGGAEF